MRKHIFIHCNKCGEDKQESDFMTYKNGKLRKPCRSCISARSLAYKKKNMPNYHKEYYQKNKEAIAEKAKKYFGKYYEKKNAWRRKHPEKMANEAAAKRARRLQATPSWADQYIIKIVYKTSTLKTKLTGVQHHVDHIAPLRGKNVCGLHCPDNLRVITAEENLRKGNQYA